MSEEIVKDFTRSEAEELNKMAREFDATRVRSDLYLMIAQYIMYIRRGYRALNYSAYKDYAEKVFGLSESTAFDRIQQVEQTLAIKQITNADLLTLWSKETDRLKLSLVPTTITRDFAKLEPAKKAVVLEQFYGLSDANRLETDPASKKIEYRQLGQIIKAHLMPSRPTSPDPSAADRELTAKKAAELAEKERARQEEHKPLFDSPEESESERIHEDFDPINDFPETEEEARAIVGGAPIEEDFVKTPVHLAQTCQRDDTVNSLFITFTGLSGCMETVKLHYALLPGNMQPR